MKNPDSSNLPLKHLEPKHLLELLSHYKEALGEYRHFLDSLNVYPVPDGDTGTNMYLTMESVLEELPTAGEQDERDGDFSVICKAAVRGAVMGARGNSGVILSQILKGYFDTFASSEMVLDQKVWIEGTVAAASCAYSAVSEPVEGTILTVIREISEGGLQAAESGVDLMGMVESFLESGSESLEKTPELLEVLKKAGVVDAGGAGLLIFYKSLAFVVGGKELEPPPKVEPINQSLAEEGKTAGRSDLGTRYEVMYLLNTEESSISNFRKSWEDIGDSIVISGTEGIWNCHIHTDEIGMAIEAGIACGTPKKIKVTDLHEQVSHNDQHLEEQGKEHQANSDMHVLKPELEFPKTQIVVTGQGDGLAQFFESLGVSVMVVGGQTRNPSVKTLVKALEALDAEEAILLPNNSNICAVAQMAVEKTSKLARVVETKTIMEGMAVLLSYDPESSSAENAKNMEEALSGVVSGEVTIAVRDSDEMGIKKGDYIGIGSSQVLSCSQDIVTTACDLIEKLITGNQDLLTLVTGSEAGEAETAQILDWLKQNKPKIEVEVVSGGQDLYHYYVGIE